MSQLQVIDQKHIDFNGDELVAVQLSDQKVYVPLRPLCERLGIDWASQFRRLKRDLVLSKLTKPVAVTATGLSPHKTGPRTTTMVALPLEYLNGWLFGINASRVKETIRDKLIKYQVDCYHVLSQAFLHNTVTHRPDTLVDELLEKSDDPSAVAYRHAMAIANIAREQVVLRLRVDSAEDKLLDHDNRLELIEAELGQANRFITVSQAAQLSEAVRAVGLMFSKATGRNEYGGVYGELHRRFGINSYKRLPAAKFEDAMSWLRQWHEDLTGGDDTPF